MRGGGRDRLTSPKEKQRESGGERLRERGQNSKVAKKAHTQSIFHEKAVKDAEKEKNYLNVKPQEFCRCTVCGQTSGGSKVREREREGGRRGDEVE